jgi:hypothetical protein
MLRKAIQRVPILIDRLSAFHRRRIKSRFSCSAVVRFIGGCETLAATTGEVDNELWGHEAGDCATELLFEVEDGREWCPQVFDTADEVTCVDVVL